MSAAFSDLLVIREVLATNLAFEAQIKQRLQQRMGEATRAVFETGSISWKRSKDGVGLDILQLLKDQPELAQQYPLAKTGSRRFLVNG